MKNKHVRFKPLPANTLTLFPENIYDKVSEDHPVRLVNTVVDQLDISHIVSEYKGGGASSYHPKMLIKVLFYAYFNNIYSCRKIEKALQENIYFMWISGESTPDFRTINNFRGKRLKEHIQRLFADIVRLLHDLGYVSLNIQYIDGTKIESSSNRYRFVWKGSVEKYKEKLETKIDRVLTEIDSHIKSDSEEENTPTLSKPINSETLKNKINELNTIQQEKAVKKKLKELEEKDLPRLEKYETQLSQLGERNSYSKTDEDATFMRLKDDHMKNGQLKPAYNTQISTEEQFVTHYSIHQKAGDTTTLKPHLETFKESYHKQSNVIVADAGYGSEENYEHLESEGITGYVKYNYFHKEQKKSHKNNLFLADNLYYNKEMDFLVCPMGQRMEPVGKGKRESRNGYISQLTYYRAKRCTGCPLRSMCHKSKDERVIQINHRLKELKKKAKERLNSEEGKQYRSKRPAEVEAVFGQMKSNNRFTRFTMKGMNKVILEFGLMVIGHNLRKLSSKLIKYA